MASNWRDLKEMVRMDAKARQATLKDDLKRPTVASEPMTRCPVCHKWPCVCGQEYVDPEWCEYIDELKAALTALTAERDDAYRREESMYRQLEDARTELAEVTAERDRLVAGITKLRDFIGPFDDMEDGFALECQRLLDWAERRQCSRCGGMGELHYDEHVIACPMCDGDGRVALKGHTHPRPCSICRREDCTTEHACE